jgi:hypothetical protein
MPEEFNCQRESVGHLLVSHLIFTGLSSIYDKDILTKTKQYIVLSKNSKKLMAIIVFDI